MDGRDMVYCRICGAEYNRLAEECQHAEAARLDPEGLAEKLAEEERRAAAAMLGRIGGSRTSEQKARTSAENGRKGGRPKKQPAA